MCVLPQVSLTAGPLHPVMSSQRQEGAPKPASVPPKGSQEEQLLQALLSKKTTIWYLMRAYEGVAALPNNCEVPSFLPRVPGGKLPWKMAEVPVLHPQIPHPTSMVTDALSSVPSEQLRHHSILGGS